jgi:hypothetical protein
MSTTEASAEFDHMQSKLVFFIYVWAGEVGEIIVLARRQVFYKTY